MKDERWEKFVRKLVDDTSSGRLIWTDSRDLLTRENARDGIYLAKILESNILVYRYRQRVWIDEDQFEWSDEVAIEIIDERGNKLWRLPDVSYRHALIDQVECRMSGALDLLNEYLGEE